MQILKIQIQISILNFEVQVIKFIKLFDLTFDGKQVIFIVKYEHELHDTWFHHQRSSECIAKRCVILIFTMLNIRFLTVCVILHRWHCYQVLLDWGKPRQHILSQSMLVTMQQKSTLGKRMQALIVMNLEVEISTYKC